jgi:hypothetical protein
LFLLLVVTSATHCIAADDPIIFSTSAVLSGTADSNLFGQSFTVSDPVTVSSVELYVQRKSGGSSFQVFLKPFDPWTNTAGAALTTVAVPLEALPTATGGGWITVDFGAPVMIEIPGVYGVFVDTDSNGFPDGYNGYGYAEGDSIVGGRLVGPTFNRDVEMMIRIRGTAATGALLPTDLVVPRFKSITSERRYTAFGTFTFVRFTWDTQTGAVYRILRSDNLTTWLDNKLLRLGDGAETYYETSNQYKDTSFMKVMVVPLGDYKK